MRLGLSGPPPAPIAVKRAKGNTRKVRKGQFEAEVSPEREAIRGKPPMPEALKSQAALDELERQLDTLLTDKQVDKHEVKRIETAIQLEHNLIVARKHWNYLVKELAANDMLATLDQGVLVGLCLNFAGQFQAVREGKWNNFTELQGKYIAAADRCGLNESARARLPRKVAPKVDPLEEALSRDLPEPLQ